MSEKTITPEQATHIAQEWAAVSDASVNTTLDIAPVDGGYFVEAVVYSGTGPFEWLGSATAMIDGQGRLRRLDAA
jgi:hypothetical protein